MAPLKKLNTEKDRIKNGQNICFIFIYGPGSRNIYRINSYHNLALSKFLYTIFFASRVRPIYHIFFVGRPRRA